MNELIQEQLQEVGFEVKLETIDWEALRSRRQAGAQLPRIVGCPASITVGPFRSRSLH